MMDTEPLVIDAPTWESGEEDDEMDTQDKSNDNVRRRVSKRGTKPIDRYTPSKNSKTESIDDIVAETLHKKSYSLSKTPSNWDGTLLILLWSRILSI